MRRDEIDVGGVKIPTRLRDVDPKKVSALAESMDLIGLQTPITVWDDDSPTLVTGAHRLAAAKSLGWEYIDVVFTDADEIDRQLWEIDENLMRSELSPTQEAEHLAKRKELWEMKSSGVICPTGGGRPGENKGFAAETADVTGTDKRNINKAVARAEKVSEDIRDEIRGTDLDKGVVLDELARTPPEQQRARLAEFRSEREQEVDPDERQLNILQSAWNKSSSEARRRFLDWAGL
jgi:ParB family transcriptional regulator, chromosome partitioning protein